MSVVFRLLLAALLLMVPGTIRSQENFGSVVVDVPSVQEMLSTRGSEAKLNLREAGDPWLDVTTNGIRWRLYFVQCEHKPRPACLSMTMLANFAPPANRENLPAVVNRWNSTRRFTRVFWDVDDDPALATDLVLSRASADYVQDALDRWIGDMNRFRAFLRPAG